MSDKRTRKYYSKEFKLEAVKLTETIGATKAAIELGVSKKSIQNWMRGISISGNSTQTKKTTVTELEAELRAAKKEIKNLKLINDVLKKSTAIFSKDQIGN